MAQATAHNPDALPQPLGDFKPLDEWQAHINTLFYGFRGTSLHRYYQTFTSGDHRLAHALAQDYYDRVRKRDQAIGDRQGAIGGTGLVDSSHSLSPIASRLTVMEWSRGNGNLAACFLSHLKTLDCDGLIYPRIRYVLVNSHAALLEAARAHAGLAQHREHVETLVASSEHLAEVKDGTVDRILCAEIWNELPTKLMLRRAGEIEEEFLCPNVNETKHAEIADWSGFLRAFEAADVPLLKTLPPFLEDLVWEREYRKVEWKSVPYRKTITEFLKEVDEQVLVPVNLGACASVKEAKRLLAPGALGLSSFDAGAADRKTLNDPDKPCYGVFGGQYSFMVNFPFIEGVAYHLGLRSVTIEAQREFVGRVLGANVITVMDLLACHPSAGTLQGWQQDRLILKTIQALNAAYRSPYERPLQFPIPTEAPPEARAELEAVLHQLRPDGVPDTVAYLTEDEILGAVSGLEALGYEGETIQMALTMPPQPVDYLHFFCTP